ncbi:MAG TPA: SdrD B-like domain-containing protein [Candidatus Binatia bacterium]|nr:SdrD B-like domain-containing protein [Candidatus Binatia bacterium]
MTVDARDLVSGSALPRFTYIVNVDNSRFIDRATRQPSDPFPTWLTTESNSPIVAEGDQSRTTVTLPDGRYLVTVRAPDHKMWGKHVTLPQDAGAVRIDLTEASDAHPLPLGKIRVFVFEDNAWTNGAPDDEEAGLGGFQIGLEEQTRNEVTVDYHNAPLCGGICLTNADGFVEVENLGPATYFIDVHPPPGPCNDNPDSQWYQTTTIEGGFSLQAGIEEGSDGTESPGLQLWQPPNVRTAFWFGFICAPTGFAAGGAGAITGTARNWQGWPPFEVLTLGEPVQDPFVALSDASTDRLVYAGRGDSAGNFDIQGVPAGAYNMAIWDEQLSYIIRLTRVTVAEGETVDVNEIDPLGNVGIGVSRWFGWLGGYVYKDLNLNGVMDPGEPVIPNTDVDLRWRDGTIKESTVTGPDGYYEYPTAEGGPLGRWFIGEQGFSRFGVTGASVHDEHDPGIVTPVPTALGGALLTNQLVTEGHRSWVDWGKYDYARNPDTGQIEGMQIVGITFLTTTRNEFDARFQASEDYEPGMPGVTVYLESEQGVILNKYVTDKWKHPQGTPPTAPDVYAEGCAVRDASGNDVSAQLNPQIGPACLEVPATGNQTKDGAFDGGYAFADYCPDGFDEAAPDPDTAPCWNADHTAHEATRPLVAGTYVTHAIMPADPSDTRPCNPPNDNGFKNVSGGLGSAGPSGCLYRPVKEEDVNVDLGNVFVPAIPPPPCAGDDHVIDQSTLTERSPYFGQTGAHAPLCDKRRVVLQQGQNANADFHLMTNFPTGVDVEQPGRLVGLVTDDIFFERNPQSVWYGEARPIGGIPIGIYQRVDTVPPTPGSPYTPDNWRLFTTVYTSPEGTYEALLPSTETLNCPIPQGPCPGMYLVKVNDPGTRERPNDGYNPNLRSQTTVWDVWPGMTTQLDTPLVPMSGAGCQDPAVEPRPELLQVSRPYVRASDTGAGRRITILADFIGSAGPAGMQGGRVTLTDQFSGDVATLTRSNGGIVSWTQGTPDRIVISVPVITAGPKQLAIISANANGGLSSVNGITIHVLGRGYNPPVVQVPPPGTSPHAIQDAVDAAAPGSLLVLSPGVYDENVILWKPLKLQGLGPGGIVGAHELQSRAPEDPRFDVSGSVIDGRFFAQNAMAYDATIAAHAPYAGVDATRPVLRGADITVLAQSPTAYDLVGSTRRERFLSAARIDGLGLTTGRGEGAGGIQLQAHANNLQITNNVLENNAGTFAGGIGLGQPYSHDSHNWNVRIGRNRLIGNGGMARSGGIGIFYGSNAYEVADSVVCANFGAEYGAGISHWGLSPGGSIHDNRIYYNESVDSGAGIAIQTELPVGGGLGDGTGTVDVDRNLIQSNYSGDDGGGIFVADALTWADLNGDGVKDVGEPVVPGAAINVRNNMIVDNGAADLGGAITLEDALNVAIINNTIANNVSTATGESSGGTPHAAGLVSEANDPLLQALLPAGASDFSNPVALFNNIFWNNEAFTLSQPGPGATLVSQGFIDFEVFGTANNADTFTPRYSDLTNGQILGPDGVPRPLPGGQGNVIGADPSFVTPFTLQLTVSGSRLDPQAAAVTITGADPPVGLTGDYHIALPAGLAARLAAAVASQVIDRGVRCSNTPVPPNAGACTGGGIAAPTIDYDGDSRPIQLTGRLNSLWDLGADESVRTP